MIGFSEGVGRRGFSLRRFAEVFLDETRPESQGSIRVRA